jgi:hypothetical protein
MNDDSYNQMFNFVKTQIKQNSNNENYQRFLN